MIKKQILILFGALLLLNISHAFSMPLTMLAFDKTANPDTTDTLPPNFRDLSATGLNAIASAQFSEAQLQAVRQKYPNDIITLIDLRGESHGFINGEAVAWHSVFEKENQGKDFSDILLEEMNRLNLVQENGQVTISKNAQRNRETGWYNNITPEVLSVSYTATEEALAKKNGFAYKRFVIRDFDKPDAKEFARMVDFIKTTPKNQKLYVHCAGGKGRTGMFLVLLDIIQNGQKTPLETIFKRQNALGAARLDEISQKEAWSDQIAQERLHMIEDFYKTEVATHD